MATWDIDSDISSSPDPAHKTPPDRHVGPGDESARDAWDLDVPSSSEGEVGEGIGNPASSSTAPTVSMPSPAQHRSIGNLVRERSRSPPRRSVSPVCRSTPSPSPRRADRVASPCLLADVPMPKSPDSIRWWANPLWQSMLHKRNKLPRVCPNPFRAEAFGAGALSEGWGYKVATINTLMHQCRRGINFSVLVRYAKAFSLHRRKEHQGP
jgi:hypothetical protein